MIQAIQRNTVLFVGLLLAGLIGALAAPALTSPRGAPGPTLFHAESIFGAVVAVLLVLGMLAVIGIVVARFLNAAVGLFVVGAGLFVLTGQLETVQELAFAGNSSRSTLAMLAVETAAWAGLALLMTIVVFALGGPLPDVEPKEYGQPPHPLLSADAFKCAAAGALMLPAIWLIAQSPMKGQMVGTAVAGGVLAGLAGRLFSPHVQPMLVFASPVLFGAIGHLLAMIMLKQPMDEAFVTGNLSRFALPMPIDLAAGSLMGVAIGLGWAKAFLQHEDDPKDVRG